MKDTDEYEPLTGSIIGCAFRVYNVMGHGYAEKIYENCLEIELKKSGHNVQTQVPIQVTYDGEIVGDYIADLLVNDTCMIELKACAALNGSHSAQLVNYLKSTGKPVGLLLNFGPNNVEIVRRTSYWKPNQDSIL